MDTKWKKNILMQNNSFVCSYWSKRNFVIKVVFRTVHKAKYKLKTLQLKHFAYIFSNLEKLYIIHDADTKNTQGLWLVKTSHSFHSTSSNIQYLYHLIINLYSCSYALLSNLRLELFHFMNKEKIEQRKF